ncbi:hypothetical protein QEH46_gp36 [Rothia phage Spartoi]|uniref:Uncharacterized protein n=1 Tax=Rothia phage Spartoi TaxID=2483661 RepID=A0A5K7NJB3_9CAUD|nr:hypothetical protein QEH46_gp36 [Rothia phage Spartoi]AZF88238.1 hypothetical protein SEA_SPARTOI_36 [Rothia phage Spartoi]
MFCVSGVGSKTLLKKERNHEKATLPGLERG